MKLDDLLADKNSRLKEYRVILDSMKKESRAKLEKLREIATDKFDSDDRIVIGVNGSVARREFTSGSDIDLFFLFSDYDLSKKKAILMQRHYSESLIYEKLKLPASGGVFEKPIGFGKMVSSIGGEKDTNKYITRRMLYLLEGEWIHNEDKFKSLRTELIRRYVPCDLDDHKLCLFLLNDIVRYWRTICIDFEHKTTGDMKPKAIRLIKLRFSRMLLYFAGVAAVSKTMGICSAKKRDMLTRLLAIPPVDRLEVIYGEESCAPALADYATFLHCMNCTKFRKSLESSNSEALRADEFKKLKELAENFKKNLLCLLDIPHDKTSRIVTSLLL